MRALQLDPATLSEVRRQRARAIFGRAEGRLTSVDRENNTLRTTTEADFRQANGLSVARNSVTPRSSHLIRGAPENSVEQVAKNSVEKASASLRSAMKLSLAQLESEFDRVNSACRPASPMCKKDSAGVGSVVTSIIDAYIRAALRSVVDVERAVAAAASDTSAMPPEHYVGTLEDGPGQHVPGLPPCGDTRRLFRTTAGGYRDACAVDEIDARRRYFKRSYLPPVLHYGVVCDECETTVRGRRFKCVTCTDYDLCNSCKLMGHHSYHNFKRIASPLPAVMVPNVHVACSSRDGETTEDGRHQCCEGVSSPRRGHGHESYYPPPCAAAPVRAAGAEKDSAESAERTEVERTAVHENVWCDVCDRTIVGTRFKCGNCDDFDLCFDCEAKIEHDRDHVFLKIRRPVALKSVRILYSTTNAPEICQEVQQAPMVCTDVSAATGPSRVEEVAESSPSFHHEGTETIAVQKCDRVTATDQSNTATSETQKTQNVSVFQDDTGVTTLQSVDVATPPAPSKLSDGCARKVDNGSGIHGHVESGDIGSAGKEARGVTPSSSSAAIEDEFVMVSPADDLLEPPNCESNERVHCLLPTAFPFSLEMDDSSLAENPACSAPCRSTVAFAASTCTNPAAATDNRNPDAGVKQIRKDDIAQPNQANHGGFDVDDHCAILGLP